MDSWSNEITSFEIFENVDVYHVQLAGQDTDKRTLRLFLINTFWRRSKFVSHLLSFHTIKILPKCKLFTMFLIYGRNHCVMKAPNMLIWFHQSAGVSTSD